MGPQRWRSACFALGGAIALTSVEPATAGDAPSTSLPATDDATAEALRHAEELDSQVEALQEQGEYRKAEPLARQSLTVREQAVGPDHSATGTSLYNLASLLEDMDDYAGAKPLYVRALAISEKANGPEHRTTGRRLNSLGVLLSAMGEYAEAKPLLLRALAISEKENGPDHSTTAVRLRNLAFLLENTDEKAAAKPLYVRALAISERANGPDHPATSRRLSDLASLLEAMGDRAGAKPLYVRALAISEKANGPEHPTTGWRLSDLASLLEDMGNYAEAKPLYARALSICEKANGPDDPATAAGLNRLAISVQQSGDYAEARPLYERALAISEKSNGPDHRLTGTYLSNLGSLLHDMGDYARAKPLFVRALAISERAEGPEHRWTGTKLNNFALLLKDMGDYAGAKPLLVRALAISEKAEGPDHPATARNCNNLALVLAGMRDYAGAKPLYLRALAISEKANGPDHPLTGTYLNNLALLLKDVGDYAGARPFLERALAISEEAEGPDHPATARNLNNLALVLVAMRDYAGAKPLYVRALAVSEMANGPEHPSTERILHNLAALLRDMNDFAGAKPLFERALRIAESFVRRTSLGAPRTERLALVATTRSLVDSFLAASPKFGSNGYAEVLRFKGLVRRLDALDHALARHPDPALHERVDRLVAVERLLSALANAIPPVTDGVRRNEWRERYAALSAEREERTGRLAREFAPFRKALEEREPGVAEVQSRLLSDEALIDVFQSDGRYLAWVVPSKGDVSRVDLGKADDVEALAAAFAEAIDASAGEADSVRWTTAGRKLREMVLAPLLAVLPVPPRTLYLVPDAALAAVPFEALPGKDAGKSLVDEARIVYLSMAQDLVSRDDASSKSGTGAFVVGSVDFEHANAMRSDERVGGTVSQTSAALARVDRAPRGGKFDPLPATAVEIDGLEARLGTAAVLTAARATEGRVRSMAPGKRILHFATHGFVREDLMVGLRRSEADERRFMTDGADRHLARGHDPMLLAGLAMAGANPREGADGDDGILTAAEVSYMDLEGCDLVVLSACETARGTAEAGEGVLGLVHGFELAGAKSVVGSLWKVSDEATRLLMDKFYEGYLRKEKPLAPSEALREAALWLRDSKPGGRDYSAPRYWAAFVCYERK